MPGWLSRLSIRPLHQTSVIIRSSPTGGKFYFATVKTLDANFGNFCEKLEQHLSSSPMPSARNTVTYWGAWRDLLEKISSHLGNFQIWEAEIWPWLIMYVFWLNRIRLEFSSKEITFSLYFLYVSCLTSCRRTQFLNVDSTTSRDGIIQWVGRLPGLTLWTCLIGTGLELNQCLFASK